MVCIFQCAYVCYYYSSYVLKQYTINILFNFYFSLFQVYVYAIFYSSCFVTISDRILNQYNSAIYAFTETSILDILLSIELSFFLVISKNNFPNKTHKLLTFLRLYSHYKPPLLLHLTRVSSQNKPPNKHIEVPPTFFQSDFLFLMRISYTHVFTTKKNSTRYKNARNQTI